MDEQERQAAEQKVRDDLEAAERQVEDVYAIPKGRDAYLVKVTGGDAEGEEYAVVTRADLAGTF